MSKGGSRDQLPWFPSWKGESQTGKGEWGRGWEWGRGRGLTLEVEVDDGYLVQDVVLKTHGKDDPDQSSTRMTSRIFHSFRTGRKGVRGGGAYLEDRDRGEEETDRSCSTGSPVDQGRLEFTELPINVEKEGCQGGSGQPYEVEVEVEREDVLGSDMAQSLSSAKQDSSSTRSS